MGRSSTDRWDFFTIRCFEYIPVKVKLTYQDFRSYLSSTLAWLLHQSTAARKMSQRPEPSKLACGNGHRRLFFFYQRHVVIDKRWKVLRSLLAQLIHVFKLERIIGLVRLLFFQLVLINPVCYWYFTKSFNRPTTYKVSLINLEKCMKKW